MHITRLYKNFRQNKMAHPYSATAAFILGLAIVLAPAGKAMAIAELSCIARSEITYSPGLRLFEQETAVTFDVNYSTCESLNGSPIISGSRTGNFVGSRSCLTLPPSGSGIIDVMWNTGQVSQVYATTQSTDVGGQTVHLITGPVISGPFIGRMFNEQIVQLSLDLLDCLTAPGVTSQDGVGALEIL